MEQSTDSSTRVRRSKKELRELVLGSGIEVLRGEGLGTGVEHLTFKRVLDHLQESSGIRITPASLIRRVWKDQEDFQLDVVRTIINQQGDDEVIDVAEALAEAFALIDVSTPEMRRATLAEMIRVTAASYLRSASTSLATIQTALAAYMVAGGAVGENESIVSIFKDANTRLTKQYVELYEAGLAVVGWRIKPTFSMEQASVAISSYSEGVLLRYLVDPQSFEPLELTRMLDGAIVEWDLFGFGMHAMVEAFAEEDPSWTGSPG